MSGEVHATALFAGPDRGTLNNVVLRHDAGLITAITESAAPPPARRSFVIPAFVNAHDHARPTASSFGAVDMPLESWILRSAFGTPPDAYLAAASAMARSARCGCGSMMIHYTRPSGKLPMVEEAREIARAAGDVGIRIAFALAVRDRNPVVYGDSEPVLSALSAEDRRSVEQLFVRPAMSPRDYIELTETIASEISGRGSTCSSAPPGCNGARISCWKPSPKAPRAAAAAFTCICWRPSISAPGPTGTSPMAWSATSATLVCCHPG